MAGRLIIDSFAGGGGASTGIEIALGRGPDVAINHSAAALALHAANHPDTLHLDSNIWDVDPRSVTQGRPVGLLWASPDCKHFSKAKGGAVRDRNVRDLAWVVVRWAEEVRPDVILMENVEEFRTWCPVGEDGQPVRGLSGVTYDLWLRRFRAAGYKVQARELRACDYGAPTIRKRLFIIARRDGRRIVWPKPTHGDPRSEAVRKGRLLPWRTAAGIIDWSLPCPSIFDTAPEVMARHGLRAVRPLAVNTMARVARGMKRYVLDAERPFLVNLTHGGRVEDLAEPARTITGAHRGEKAVVAPHLVSIAHGDSGGRREYPLSDPLGTVSAGGVQHALVAPALLRTDMHKSNAGCAYDAAEPLRTITTAGGHAVLASYLAVNNTHHTGTPVDAPVSTLTTGGHHLLVAPSLLSLKGIDRRDRAADLPHPTVLAGGGHSALLAPVLTYAQQGGSICSARDPLHTVTASAKDQNALIAASLIQTGYGERPGQAPRALDLGRPLGTVVAAASRHAAVAAFLAQHNTERGGRSNPGRAADEPMSTATGTGSQQGVVAAHVVRHFGQSVGHGIDEPLGTVTAGGGGKSGLVAAWMAKWYGAHQDPRLDEPLHTVTTRDRFDVETATLAAPPFAPEHEARAREVAAFLRAHGAWDDREYVTLEIAGATFVVVDIGMRMLTPRELFRAQGFPDDYVIEGAWREDAAGEWAWHPFPKDVQIGCCGNSVCPPLAAALVTANCAHLLGVEGQEAVHG